MRADVIVDMQFGSTGKGAVAAFMAGRREYDSSVRVQSIQAGHTVYYNGKAYKMRTIPCAWVDQNVMLVLGPGCFIEKQLLLDEIAMVSEATGEDVRDRLFLDFRAFYVIQDDVDEEARRALESGVGSTAHGAGASLVRKLWRTGGGRVEDDGWAEEHGLKVCDTIDAIQHHRVLVEGCQGAMLSIHTSPYYPFVTTRECSAAGVIAEAGISPCDVAEVLGVFRTLPIRVGGNSGDTGGKEISWEEVNRRAGRDVSPERTTVTNRVRRIFEFNEEDFRRAVQINKPNHLFMTFADYLAPSVYGTCRMEDIPDLSRVKIVQFIDRVNGLSRVNAVRWVGTGEQAHHYILPTGTGWLEE